MQLEHHLELELNLAQRLEQEHMLLLSDTDRAGRLRHLRDAELVDVDARGLPPLAIKRDQSPARDGQRVRAKRRPPLEVVKRAHAVEHDLLGQLVDLTADLVAKEPTNRRDDGGQQRVPCRPIPGFPGLEQRNLVLHTADPSTGRYPDPDVSDTTQPPEHEPTPTLPAWVTGSRARVVPERVGPFKVLEKIGAGGAGEVWSAYDEALERTVALKLVQRSRVAGEHETRLLREAQALAKLSHPNIVTVHDADRTQEHVYIAMELVDGGTLKSAFANPASGPRVRLGWLLQAARGLQAAHDLGLIHRDFKPANALLGSDGRVRVADFGLARVAAPQSRTASTLDPRAERPSEEPLHLGFEDLTITGAILGTPAYMSPEQRLGERVTPATDQFSFCVVAWQALFGVNPLAELNLAQWVAGNASLPAAPSVPGVPSSLATVLLRGMHPTPEGRHASMAPIMRALESAIRPRRTWKSAAVIGAVVVAGIGIAAAKLPAPVEQCAAHPLGWTSLRHASVVWNLADGTDAGHTAAEVAEAGLREVADAWTSQARSRCHQNPHAPAPCLDRQRAAYERACEILQRDTVRSRVPEILETLTLPCETADADDAAAWIRVAQLRPELAAGNTQLVLRGSAQIEATLTQRRHHEAPKLQTESLRLRGAAQAQRGDAHGAVETLRVAYNIAERSGLDAAAAVAADLATLTAIELDQPERGRVWLASARALAPLPPDVRASVALARGVLAAKDGQWRDAAAAFEHAAQLQETAPPYTDGPAEAWVRQAEALAHAGDSAQALRCISQALQRRVRIYGQGHPKTVAAQQVKASVQSL